MLVGVRDPILKARPDSLVRAHRQVLIFCIGECENLSEPRISYQAALLSLPSPISSHTHPKICLTFHALSQACEIFSPAKMI